MQTTSQNNPINLNISNCQVNNALAKEGGGIIYSQRSSIGNIDSSMTISNSNFNYISTLGNGGGLYISDSSISLTIENSNFLNGNAAITSGGFLYADALGTISIKQS